jgi:hypothetical protein
MTSTAASAHSGPSTESLEPLGGSRYWRWGEFLNQPQTHEHSRTTDRLSRDRVSGSCERSPSRSAAVRARERGASTSRVEMHRAGVVAARQFAVSLAQGLAIRTSQMIRRRPGMALQWYPEQDSNL